MHKFLRSIGFSKLKELDDQDRLLQDVLVHYDFKKSVVDEEGHLFAEISKEFAPDIGITVCGSYDEDNLFHMEYYFPFFWGSQVTSYEEIAVERHYANESFAAACDDMRVGTTLIFYVSNAGEYIDVQTSGRMQKAVTSVSLSALAESGTILFPVRKEQKALPADPKKLEERNSLFAAAQSGDEDAIESLTMEDYDAYSMLSNRVRNEDIYTIVDSYFMPYGMECDLYNIMGDITSCEKVRNHATGEVVYQLGVNCNDVPLDVCINEKGLTGEPEVGRRLKAIIWLQGRLNF
ncbi:MAG: DUF3881 family protein [Bilifractor sp.]